MEALRTARRTFWQTSYPRLHHRAYLAPDGRHRPQTQTVQGRLKRLSLLGSALGFATSFPPKLMGYAQDKHDKTHELVMITAQAQPQVRLQGVKLEAMHISADIRGGEALLKHSSLAATVCPVLSYLFFVEFFCLTVRVDIGWMTLGAYNSVWNDDAPAIKALKAPNRSKSTATETHRSNGVWTQPILCYK